MSVFHLNNSTAVMSWYSMENAHYSFAKLVWFSWCRIHCCKRDGWSMARYFYPSLTAAVMMITAASPQSIELTHIHLKYRSMCFPFVTIMKNHLKLGWWPSPSPDGGIGRDNPTSLRLHVESFLHCASSSDHFTPADQVWASFGQAVIT